MPSKPNRFGAAFRNKRERVRIQMKDLRDWSKLALKAHDTIDIDGL